MTTIKIDGNDYAAGSPEARAAQARLDSIRNQVFLADHPEIFERNVRAIRSWEQLDRVRQDATATALLARDLVFAAAEVERRVYAETRTLRYIRPDTNFPAGAQVYARRYSDHVGKAKVTHMLAGDAPRVDVSGSEDFLPFRWVTASYGYTVEDLERAAFSRMPLVQWKRDAAVDAIARGIDRIGRSGTFGDPEGDSKLTGLFNNVSVTLHTLTNGEWPSATAAEILADLQELESAIITASLDTQPEGYRLLLPTAMEGRLRTLKVDANSDMTVANYFLANARLITSIERWGELDSAVSPGVRASDPPQAILMPIDQMKAGIYWPMPISYDEMPPEIRNFEWVVNARAKVGGVEILRPFLMLYVQNLD